MKQAHRDLEPPRQTAQEAKNGNAGQAEGKRRMQGDSGE